MLLADIPLGLLTPLPVHRTDNSEEPHRYHCAAAGGFDSRKGVAGRCYTPTWTREPRPKQGPVQWTRGSQDGRKPHDLRSRVRRHPSVGAHDIVGRYLRLLLSSPILLSASASASLAAERSVIPSLPTVTHVLPSGETSARCRPILPHSHPATTLCPSFVSHLCGHRHEVHQPVLLRSDTGRAGTRVAPEAAR